MAKKKAPKLVMRRTLRCWTLHPEGRPHETEISCTQADYPDPADAERYMRGEVAKWEKAKQNAVPLKIPGLNRLGGSLARKL